MSRELELTPFLLRDGGVSNSDQFIFDAFFRVNPRLKELIDTRQMKNPLKILKLYMNPEPDVVMRYNTVAELETDGCDLTDGMGNPVKIFFSYGRWNAAEMEFKETETTGVPDVPLIVSSNTKEGVNATFFGLLDDVILLEDEVVGFEGVKKWRGVINRENRAAIFTRFRGIQKVQFGDFIIYAKAYDPDRGFEDSDFVE